MTTLEKYRQVIESNNRWQALTLYREDINKKVYYDLTDKERMQIDLLIDLAKESL